MKYKKTDLAKIFQDLGNLEKIEDVRVRAAEIQKDLESDYEEHEGVVNQNTQFQNDIKDLQKANNKLFKMIGTSEDDKSKDEPDDEQDKNKNLTYENLFNEKGELK